MDAVLLLLLAVATDSLPALTQFEHQGLDFFQRGPAPVFFAANGSVASPASKRLTRGILSCRPEIDLVYEIPQTR